MSVQEAMQGLDEINAFNQESARLQELLDVDPNACLKIVAASLGARTSLDTFFGGLKRGEWVTPALGEWFDHDHREHWQGIRELNPVFVPAVMFTAAVGEQQLQSGDREAAVKIGNKLDFFIDRATSYSHYNQLLAVSGVNSATIDSRFSYVALSNYRQAMKVAQNL